MARNRHSKGLALPTPGMVQRQEAWRSCDVTEQKMPHGAKPRQVLGELSGSRFERPPCRASGQHVTLFPLLLAMSRGTELAGLGHV